MEFNLVLAALPQLSQRINLKAVPYRVYADAARLFALSQEPPRGGRRAKGRNRKARHCRGQG